jgi:hypothetical protein
MSDISNQLIKDSYNYVLQSDLSTGVVFRIGGGIPVNPKFISGLTVNSGFTYSNGTEQPGFVLITDAFGNATWGPISGSTSEDYLPLSGGTVTGATIFTSGLTADTISATTYLGLSIPTNTSQLINDGEDGSSPYVTADQLPSNLILFATNASSDIATYFKLVTSIDDPDYNTSPVDISTGAITTTNQFIASLATSAGVLLGNPGIVNLSTVGNIRRTSGTGNAEFYYEVYQRNSGGTETLVATSSATPPVTVGVYTEFIALALLNNGTFLPTDRIVIKYYANREGSGSDPSYEFQFGGTSPVRTSFPVPASNLPFSLDTLSDVNISGVTNGQALVYNTSNQLWENKTIISGTTGYITKFNTENTIDDSVIFQSGSSIIISGSTFISGSTSITQDLSVNGSIIKQIKTITGTTYTLQEEDKGRILHFTSNTDVTATIPTGLTSTNRYEGKQLGDGQLIFGTDLGVTLRVGASEVAKTAEKYSVFGLDVIGSEEYMLYGKLELS